jgi:hypothetical protein
MRRRRGHRLRTGRPLAVANELSRKILYLGPCMSVEAVSHALRLAAVGDDQILRDGGKWCPVVARSPPESCRRRRLVVAAVRPHPRICSSWTASAATVNDVSAVCLTSVAPADRIRLDPVATLRAVPAARSPPQSDLPVRVRLRCVISQGSVPAPAGRVATLTRARGRFVARASRATDQYT